MIPEPLPEVRKVLEIRAQLVRLKNIMPPAAVLQMFELDLDDLELLATIEDELRGGDEPQEEA